MHISEIGIVFKLLYNLGHMLSKCNSYPNEQAQKLYLNWDYRTLRREFSQQDMYLI